MYTRHISEAHHTMEQAFFDEEHVYLEHHVGNIPVLYHDGRLFPDAKLYGEGQLRPTCRGYFHAASCLFLIAAMVVLIRDCKDSKVGQTVSIFYISTNMFCYGVSAIYHIFSLSPQNEIIMQKLDHCGIPVMSVGTMMPVSIFLLGNIFGTLLIVTSTFFCIITCVNIFRNRPSIVMQMTTAVWWFIPYWYPLYNAMTTFEFSCMILTIVLKAIGVFVFANESPDPFPKTFGYHEIFHIFVILGGACIFLCNWSVIHRFCSMQYYYYL